MNLKEIPNGRADALTTRVVVLVAFVGAGFWYVLWKWALTVVAGR